MVWRLLRSEAVHGVGRVRNQLTQEHLFLGINRVHHYVQELRNVCLEGTVIALRFVNHQSIPLNDREGAGSCWPEDLRTPYHPL